MIKQNNKHVTVLINRSHVGKKTCLLAPTEVGLDTEDDVFEARTSDWEKRDCQRLCSEHTGGVKHRQLVCNVVLKYA